MKKVETKAVDTKNLWFVITASSVGTLIEFYDFYIFGTLTVILSQQFFPQDNPTIAFLLTLATFAAGFIFRPFGAVVFGRLGDLVGRKHTFLLTLILMGGSTFAIGLVPGYKTIGIAAPILIVVFRILQGLALGGEYGGAATYVAESAPKGRRGYFTSFIQTTATLGLVLALGVILIIRESIGVDEFYEWGWRIPFLLSAALVGVSIFIRMRMAESPMFAKLKAEGKTSTNPLRESFGKKENLRLVMIALFGVCAGQAVVWHGGQFYALTFIQRVCNIELVQSYSIMAIALIVATPLFIIFGKLSDTFGRKYIMMGGLLLAVIFFRPIFQQMYQLSDLSIKEPVPLAKNISRSVTPGKDDVSITTTEYFSDRTQLITKSKQGGDGKVKTGTSEIKLSQNAFWFMVMLVFVLVFFVAMVYGPIAAFLVELFPTRIRYTSMSVPYHLGNGVFGGLTPLLSTSLFELSKTPSHPAGDPTAGLWYPIGIAAACFVVGMIFLKNKYPTAE